MASPDMQGSNGSLPITKPRQRGGARSCYECRRRKIRCIPQRDKPSTCTECYARGSECLNQEQAQAALVTNRRRNLRERVSKVEGLLETMRKEWAEHRQLMESFRNSTSNPITQPTDLGSISVDLTSLNQSWTQLPIESPKVTHNSKDIQVLQALKLELPKGEQLHSALQKSNEFWMNKCRFSRGPKAQFSSFKEFASYAFNQGTPYDAAEVVQVLASRCDNAIFDRILSVVERVIIFDDEYMLSLEGLHCAIFQGILYSEAGQSLRAWQTWRRALTSAQILGLHKERRSIEADKIWWMLYNLDRFFSLLLGVPYTVADVHCNMDFRGGPVDDVMTCSGFVIRLSQITGKVIDHLQDCNGSIPMTSVDELARELNQIATQMPGNFWNTGPIVEKDDMTNAMQWFEKIMGHLAYYQTDIALHLPYMLKSAEHPSLTPLRDHCIQTSRKFLRSYHQLRHSSSAFKGHCRHIDSVACTACIVLILNLWRYAGGARQSTLQDANDRELIQASMNILKHSSNEMGERVARNSYQALQKLTQSQNIDVELEPNSRAKFTIPYLGKSCVTRRDFFPDTRPQTPLSPLHQPSLFAESTTSATSAPSHFPAVISNTTQVESLLWARYESLLPEHDVDSEWRCDDSFADDGLYRTQGMNIGCFQADLQMNSFLGGVHESEAFDRVDR